MAAFRFLAALFALVAILVFVSDATPWLNGTGPVAATSLETHWERLSPSTLTAARDSVSASISPVAWTALETAVLGFPTWCVFGVLALIAGLIGRRRHRVNVYVN